MYEKGMHDFLAGIFPFVLVDDTEQGEHLCMGSETAQAHEIAKHPADMWVIFAIGADLME